MKQEIAVVEIVDVDHGGSFLVVGEDGRKKKPNHGNHDRAKRKAEPLLTPLLLSNFFTVVGKSYFLFLL